MLDGAAEAEPCGQRDAARGLRRQVAEIEDDQAEASAFEQQIGGAQDLLQAVLGLPRVRAIDFESGLRGSPTRSTSSGQASRAKDAREMGHPS